MKLLLFTSAIALSFLGGYLKGRRDGVDVTADKAACYVLLHYEAQAFDYRVVETVLHKRKCERFFKWKWDFDHTINKAVEKGDKNGL